MMLYVRASPVYDIKIWNACPITTYGDTSFPSFERRSSAIIMKRIAITAALAAFLLGTVHAAPGFAEEKQIAYIDAGSSTTFVPLRFVSGYIGAKVAWSQATGRIEIRHRDKAVAIDVGKSSAEMAYGALIPLPAPSFSENGVTYVPLKLLSAAFGVQLEWQANTSSVLLTLPDKSITLPAIPRGSLSFGKPAITNQQKTFVVGKKTFAVQMVTVSLLDPRIDLDIALAGGEVGKVEELKGIADRSGAILAINGTFFDAYTDAAFKKPYGYLVNDGELLYNNSERRATFTFDTNYNAEIIGGGDFSERYRTGIMDGALQAGPRLVENGKVALNVEDEGFRDPKILTGGGARSALGITKDHKLILLTTGGATIPQLAEIMKQAGAYQAMNLDGGASSGLYYNGEYLTQPGRLISNAIVVKLKP
jgi:exopolysaccharide biosynthesis protein